MSKCKFGYKEKDGKCKKEEKNSLKFDSNKKMGLFSMILGLCWVAGGFIVWAIRPLQDCAWWNIFCYGGSVVTSPIYLILMIIFLLLGLVLIGYGIFNFVIGKR